MALNIKIFEDQILQGDTSHVRKELEGIIQASTLIKKHENDVSLNFQGLTPFDIFKKLKQEKFRTWFKKLDTEIPGLPYFLNESSNSLLFFLMGNIAYEEKESSVQFDKIEASRFFKEKMLQMRNLCLPHNINPQTGIMRISNILSGERTNGDGYSQGPDIPQQFDKSDNSPENEKKKGAIKDFLDRYGSIAFLNSDRTVKLTIVLNEIPSKISFVKNFLVKDNSFPQQFFLTVLKTDSGISEIRSLILANITDIESSIDHNGGVYIQVVTKSEDGSYQMLLGSDNVFSITVSNSLKEDLSKIELENNVSFSDEEIRTGLEIQEIKPAVQEEKSRAEPPIHEKNSRESTVNIHSETLRLKKENEELIEKVEKLEKLIEVYEDEINKKRSVKGFFGKFFS